MLIFYFGAIVSPWYHIYLSVVSVDASTLRRGGNCADINPFFRAVIGMGSGLLSNYVCLPLY